MMSDEERYLHRGLNEVMVLAHEAPATSVGDGRVTLLAIGGGWWMNMPREYFLRMFEKVEEQDK